MRGFRLFVLPGTVLPVLFCVVTLAQFGQKTQYFPQFAVGGGAVSFFTIHNPGMAETVVSLQLNRSDGTVLSAEQVEVGAGATKTVSFGGPSGTPQDGWVKVSSENEFTASLFYRITNVGNVGVLPSSEAKAFKAFTFVENGTTTGFAVANPSSTDSSDLTFRFHDKEGSPVNEAHLTLEPLGHEAFLFTEPPYSVSTDGSVDISASNPVVAVGLRLDGALLAGVPVIVPGLPIRGEWNEQSPNLIGGHPANSVADGVIGATIGGGGTPTESFPNWENRVTADYGTVGGGASNAVSGIFATVGGGVRNNAAWAGATVGGGNQNEATGVSSTVSGGMRNSAAGNDSTLGGGQANSASGNFATVGGGGGNTASGEDATVGGGSQNKAIGVGSTAGGGRSNIASGEDSTVGGGTGNSASGVASTAAGG